MRRVDLAILAIIFVACLYGRHAVLRASLVTQTVLRKLGYNSSRLRGKCPEINYDTIMRFGIVTNIRDPIVRDLIFHFIKPRYEKNRHTCILHIYDYNIVFDILFWICIYVQCSFIALWLRNIHFPSRQELAERKQKLLEKKQRIIRLQAEELAKKEIERRKKKEFEELTTHFLNQFNANDVNLSH
jgi:hypothetical protein